MTRTEDDSIGGWSQMLTSSQCPECGKTLNWKPAETSNVKDPLTVGFEARHCTHIFSLMPDMARIKMTRDPKASVPTVAELDKAIHEEETTGKEDTTGQGRNATQKAQEKVFNKDSKESKQEEEKEEEENKVSSTKDNRSTSSSSSNTSSGSGKSQVNIKAKK